MPLYEFVCRDCGTQFEQIQSYSAKGHPPCPQCGSEHVSRLLGRPAIHFKGSGWYVTDSKGSSKQSANGDSGKEGVRESGKEDAKESSAADAKPEAKSEAKPEAKGSESKPEAKSEGKTEGGAARGENKPGAKPAE